MRSICLFFVLLSLQLTANPCQAQSDPNINRTLVIATNGLTLRAGPGTKSKAVTVIPFGETVTYLHPQDRELDTIGTLTVYCGLNVETGRRECQERPIIGHWVHVRHKEMEGYVFDAYLSEHYQLNQLNSFDKERPAADFVLIDGFSNEMNPLIYHPHTYNYYGIYRKAAGAYKLRRITISQTTIDGELFISVPDQRDALYVIGAKEFLPEHTFSGKYFEEALTISGYEEEVEPSEFTVYLDDKNVGEHLPTLITSDERPEGNLILPPFSLSIFVFGAGDIDGDGLTDYLIGSAGEGSWYTYLFLSSQARRGELGRLVALNGGSCC